MKLMTYAALAAALLAVPAIAEEHLKPVKLMEINAGEASFERQFFGQVKARQSVDLAFQVGGQIVDFPVTEGLRIAKGSVIAELDQEQFELQLAQARLQKAQADRTVNRLKKLKGNTVSQVAIDDAETQAGLSEIAVSNAAWSLRHATLRAPFDALVSSRNVELYTTVGAGAPVVRIHDLSELRIEVDVPEILFQTAGNRGDNIEIFARFPGLDDVYPLDIREYDAETSDIGQTFRITFGLEPPKERVVLPGSSVTVSVRAVEPAKAIEVPMSAIVTNDTGETGVMQFDPKGGDVGHVRFVPVDIQPSESTKVRILSGLDDGAEIVVAGGAALGEGQQVRRFAGFGN
ncbi:efflux RND transporter periplasmic adaptor subunit [Shimia haliotis]|uniref:RND family efflux transporter, MFP subunit n=1 Tax=Shimia haliotis TaxID=1280847 RepID=A0A1I4DH50_9RHOB|nr:efflux RND transporter periplasmic adaptor subunit [Shimia haliotis]SFK92413.1 RND family efflux transporter, MFP subunit [Shimia haliotis]